MTLGQQRRWSWRENAVTAAGCKVQGLVWLQSGSTCERDLLDRLRPENAAAHFGAVGASASAVPARASGFSDKPHAVVDLAQLGSGAGGGGEQRQMHELDFVAHDESDCIECCDRPILLAQSERVGGGGGGGGGGGACRAAPQSWAQSQRR